MKPANVPNQEPKASQFQMPMDPMRNAMIDGQCFTPATKEESSIFTRPVSEPLAEEQQHLDLNNLLQ